MATLLLKDADLLVTMDDRPAPNQTWQPLG